MTTQTIPACAALLALSTVASWRAADAQAQTQRPAGRTATPAEWLVYVGTYTTPPTKLPTTPSKGIYVMRLDTKTGQLSAPQLAGESANPSFLALHPTRRILYAANEVSTFGGAPVGGVTAFAIGAGGTLTRLNEQGSGGSGPCYITVDRAGTAALVANYGGGTVALLPLAEDGTLKAATAAGVVQHQGSGPNPQRQKGPHAHSINLDPSGAFAVAADLGLDKLLVYRVDAKAGTLTANDPPSASVAPGAGPRHFAFHPNGRVAYAINELASTITAFDWNAKKGTLTELQTITTLPEGFTGQSFTAEVVVHPSGQFVYGSNRGHDSIAIFTVDEKTGKLTPAGHQSTGGNWPRNFAVDPSGAFLLAANQRSDSVVVFRIDQRTGHIAPTGSTAAIAGPAVVRFTTPN